MLGAHHAFHEWVEVPPYHVAVHDARDGIVWDDSGAEPRTVRSVLVEYANYTDAPLSYRLAQWMLYDTEGYAYEAELRTALYAAEALRRLKEGVTLTGQSVKGWVAFEVPDQARLAYLQFRPGYLPTASLAFASMALALLEHAPSQ